MLLSKASGNAQLQQTVGGTPAPPAPAPAGSLAVVPAPPGANAGVSVTNSNANQQPAAKPVIPAANAASGALPAALLDKPRVAYANLLSVSNEWKDPCPNGPYTYNPDDEHLIGQWHLFPVVIDKRPHNSAAPRKLAVGDRIKLGRVNGQDMIIGALGFREDAHTTARDWYALILTELEHPSYYLAKFPQLWHSDAKDLDSKQCETLRNVVQTADLSDVPYWKDDEPARSLPAQLANPELPPRASHPPTPLYVPDRLPAHKRKRKHKVHCGQALLACDRRWCLCLGDE
jgi:hypothetical protein